MAHFGASPTYIVIGMLLLSLMAAAQDTVVPPTPAMDAGNGISLTLSAAVFGFLLMLSSVGILFHWSYRDLEWVCLRVVAWISRICHSESLLNISTLVIMDGGLHDIYLLLKYFDVSLFTMLFIDVWQMIECMYHIFHFDLLLKFDICWGYYRTLKYPTK